MIYIIHYITIFILIILFIRILMPTSIIYALFIYSLSLFIYQPLQAHSSQRTLSFAPLRTAAAPHDSPKDLLNDNCAPHNVPGSELDDSSKHEVHDSPKSGLHDISYSPKRGLYDSSNLGLHDSSNLEPHDSPKRGHHDEHLCAPNVVHVPCEEKQQHSSVQVDQRGPGTEQSGQIFGLPPELPGEQGQKVGLPPELTGDQKGQIVGLQAHQSEQHTGPLQGPPANQQ